VVTKAQRLEKENKELQEKLDKIARIAGSMGMIKGQEYYLNKLRLIREIIKGE